MQWVLWMIAVAVLGLAAVAASGRLGELPGTVTDTPRPHVPTGLLTGDDLRGLRFAVVPRGYSMDQVDELLDRLARQLDAAGRTAGGPQAPIVAGLEASNGTGQDASASADQPARVRSGVGPEQTTGLDRVTALGAPSERPDRSAGPASDGPHSVLE